MQQGWEPQHALGGHTGAVVDMAWGVDRKCLLSASADQTLRITAQCQSHWCELARPQVMLRGNTWAGCYLKGCHVVGAPLRY